VFLEYKRTTYGNGDADVKEYLKDVSSFANTHGGDLVIGIEEKGGLARKVPGVAGVNPDTELQRLESLARDGIDPPPLKWSDLRYVFDIKEDCNGKEAIQA
jgi:predicted HTH transcriptional regulator